MAADAAWHKAYRARDDVKKRRAELQRLWKANNPEKAKAIKKAWLAANPEKVAAKKKRYKENNPGVIRAQKAKRRAAELQATPAWADHQKILKIYEEAYLLRQAGHDVHVDHQVPLVSDVVCGLHVEFNLQILPAAENCSKRNSFTC